MKMQLFIEGKMVVEQLFTNDRKPVAVKILCERYRHATMKKEWAVYELKESKMNHPNFKIKEDYQLKTA